MIKILVIDDNQVKIKNIRVVLESIPEINDFDTATNIVAAKKMLAENHYDLMILDLGLPNRDGDDPSPSNGISFLEEIGRVNRLIKPYHIVGLSEFDSYINDFQSNFDNELWALLKYDSTSTQWENLLSKKIEYLIASKRSLSIQHAVSYQYDIAIVTALRQTELEAVLLLPGNWNPFKIANDPTEYYKGIFTDGSRSISVIAAAAPQMGMVASSVLTNKIISNFRPKHVIMGGIAAGVKGTGNFGDILAAEISYDSGSGKIKSNDEGNSIFEPDYKSIEIEVDLKEILQVCKTERLFLDKIKKSWPGKKPEHELNLRVGPFATGAGVIQSNKVIEEIKGHSRKLIGIDMETYGVFYTAKNCSKPRPLSVSSFKSLCDFADKEKNDEYQPYAAHTSANFIYNFVLNKMEIN